MKILKLGFFRKRMFLNLFLLGSFVTFNTYGQVDLNNGLIAYLPMNGNGIDQSGNNNNASIDAGSTQTYIGVDRNMNFAKCMRFIGDNGKAEMTFGTPLLSNRNTWTVSLWVQLSSGADGMSIFGQDNLLELTYYTTGPNRFILYHPTSGSVNINLVSPFYNNWRHILVTGDNTSLKIYLNGVLTSNLAGDYTLGNNTNNTNIGGHVINQTSSEWLKGQIDDIRIYSRVVTTDEIAALSNQNLPEIAITSVSNTSFCAGEAVTVDFTTTGNIETDNIYSLQLSQPNGSFDYPIILDSVLSNSVTGTFISTIPTGVFSGTNYRLRVTSSNISATSDTTSAITINSVLGNIPSNSTYIFVGNVNGRNYYKSTTSSGGGAAGVTATNNSGYLATVYDYATNQLLYYNARDSRQYIGLNDIVQEGTYVWRDGSSPVYTNWGNGQPDNSGNEDYSEIRSDNGQWNDLSNTGSKTHFMQLAPAGFDRYFCLGDDLPLTAVSLTGATYNWTGPDGFTSTSQNPLVSNAQSQNAGTYTVTYTLGGCSASTSVQISMNPLPSMSVVAVQTDSICPNTSAIITIQNTDATITYQLRDASNNPIGAAQTGNGGVLSFDTGILTATSDFNFLYVFTTTSCSSVSGVLTVHVRTAPNAPTTTGDEVCNGGSMTISAAGAVGTGFYNWYTSAIGGSPINGLTGSTLTIDTNVTQTYYISITDDHGCESTRTPVLANVINPLNPPVDLISDLILHYKFDGDYNDYSGNGYDASLNGTMTFVTDHNQNPSSAVNSTNPSSNNNHLDVGIPLKIQQLTNQVSISVWIRQTQTWFDDGWEGQMPIINKWNGGDGFWLGLHMVNPANMTNRIRWRVSGATYLESNTNVPIGGWQHVVGTYDGSKLRIYQNGVLTGTLNYTGGISNTAANLFLFRYANGTPPNGITYRGDMDEVKIYSRALNLSEVQTLYNDESVAFENTPFCDGEGNLALTTFNFPGATYQWNGPNGFSSTDQNPAIVLNADSATYAGLYTLQVTTNGCTSPVQNAQAIIYALPSAPSVINDTVCSSGNATLTANGAPSGGSYAWYTVSSGGTPIAGETSSTLTINNLLATTNRYVAIIRNGCEGDRTAVTAVYINAVQTNLTVNGSSVCLGESTANITVNASETGVMYQAFLGANPISSQLSGGGTLVIPINTATMSAGNNTVTIQANYPSCGAIALTNTATVTVNTLPSASISASGPTSFCQGGSVDLTSSIANTYLWSTTETTASINISSSGSYSVIVTDVNGCKDTSSITVVVDQIPIPLLDTVGLTTFCQGGTVTFNVSGGTSYLWSTNETTSQITVNQSGTYNVVVTSGTCSVTSQDILVTVNSSPSVVANASESVICSGETTILTGSGANTYTWDNGVIDGVSFSPSLTNYTVTGTDLNGCEASDAITITVNPLPDASFTLSSPTFCPDASSLTLTATDPNLSTYDWYLDGSPLQLNGANTQNTTTIGVIQLTVTDINGCSNDYTETIIAGTTPLVSISVNETAFCSNATELITADFITGANYVWFKDGSPITGSILEGNTYSSSSAGDYSVQVTNTGGCTGISDTITLTTIAAPTAVITATSTSICSGDSVLISANLISGAMYEWYLNGSSLGVAQLEQNSWYATATGDYSVTITTACSTTSNLITVSQANLPNPASAINGNTLFCTGTSNTYTTSTVTGANNYYWEIIPSNAASIATGQGTTTVTINTTNQSFTLKVTPQNGCGNGTASTLSIAVGDPQLDCGIGIYFYANKTNVCEEASVIFTDASTITNPLLTPHWDFGSGASPATAVGAGPFTVTYSTSGLKTVTLTYVDGFGNIFYDETKTDYINIQGSVSTSSISGNTALSCNASNEIYSVINTSGSTYQWTVPLGATIISGQGTSSITVNFNGNAGAINVQETNTTGCIGGFVSLNISITNTVSTSPISGNEEVKCTSTNETYTVVNTSGSTYQWTIPLGASIVSGQGTNSVVINFNGNFGTVSVVETNSDGCVGTPQTILVSCSHVGIDEYTQSENVQVYPNPATQNFQVDFDNKDGGQLYLYSSDGRIVVQTTVLSQQIIDIERLEPAVYIGKIIFSNNQTYLFRLVKQ